MASTYSTNLALELIGTGEQSGTWGTTTNTNLGTLLEQAISGYVTQAITDGSGANTTITIPNGTTGVARNMFIEMTGALTFATTSLIVPANKKMYFIFNNTSGGFAVTVKVSGQTGILVPNGKKVILTCNGTDIVEAHTAIVGNATMGGTLGVTGATTLSSTLGVTGATTLSSTLAAGATTITGAATVSTTLGVTGLLSVGAGGINLTSATGTSYVVSSFTATLTGCTTSPTATFYYTVIGDTVTVEMTANLVGESNTTACTVTGFPAAIRPTNSAQVVLTVRNSALAAISNAYLDSSGVLTLHRDPQGTVFTTSGSKGAFAFCFTYKLI
jgi:fibronectin-binding autotransporter adhesin